MSDRVPSDPSVDAAAFLDVVPVPMWVYDVDTLAFLDVNEAALALYGYGRYEFESMTIDDLRPPDEVDELHRWLAARRDEPERRGVWRHQSADGTVFDAEVVARAVHWRGRQARIVAVHDVSDRSDATRLAAELDQRLSDVFSAITDGFMAIDADGRVRFLNAGGERLLGRLNEPLIGRRLWDAFPEMVDTSFHRRLVAALENGTPDRMEIEWQRAGRWGEVRMFPSSGELLLYFRDITAERAAADGANMLIARLNRLVTVSRTVTSEVASLDELFDQIPRLVTGVLGAENAVFFLLDGDELRLRSAWGPSGAVEAPAVVPRRGSFTGRAVDAGRVLSTDDLQGDERAALQGRFPVHRAAMAAGVTTGRGVVGALTVTDRRVGIFGEADERTLSLVVETLAASIDRLASFDALQRSEERFRFLGEATTDVAYDSTIQDDHIWFSSGYSNVFGWPAGDQPRSGWRDSIHPDDRPAVFAELDAAYADSAVHEFELEYRLARRSGEYATVVDRMIVLRDVAGRAVRVIGGLVDVSDEVVAEQRTLRAQRLEAVGQLTGGVAHDFNNLLTVILGGIDQLEGLLDDAGADSLELVRAAAGRGADLARRLLVFAGQQPLSARPTDAAALVDIVVSFFGRTLPDDVELRVEHGDGLWPAMVDPSELENAVLNLCLNAQNAMPSGGRLTIRTGNVFVPATIADSDDDLSEGEYVMIEVADTGTGIDPAVLDRIFEPFFTTKAVGEGTGLGLSMVHGFAKQSSGHIAVESELGAGTTARLLLPRTLVEPATRSEVETASPGRPDGSARPDSRILVAEDDQSVQAILARFLEAEGYEVHRASSGPEAIDVAERMGPFDLLVTDLAMPGGMSGLDLADRLKERQPDLAVLYTSGYADGVLGRQGGRNASELDLLHKPYRMDELAERVRVALERRPN